MPCPTEEELNNRQPCSPTQIYPYQLGACLPPQGQPYHYEQVKNCQPCVKVRVLRACGGQWSLFQELKLNSPPNVGTTIVIDGGSYKIESMLLLGNSEGYDSYEALVVPALQGGYEVGPWTSKNDCGCHTPKVYKSECGCQEQVSRCNPCERVPYPVYALKGYPW